MLVWRHPDSLEPQDRIPGELTQPFVLTEEEKLDAKALGMVGVYSRPERQKATVEGQADQSCPSEWSKEEKAGREGGRLDLLPTTPRQALCKYH